MCRERGPSSSGEGQGERGALAEERVRAKSLAHFPRIGDQTHFPFCFFSWLLTTEDVATSGLYKTVLYGFFLQGKTWPHGFRQSRKRNRPYGVSPSLTHSPLPKSHTTGRRQRLRPVRGAPWGALPGGEAKRFKEKKPGATDTHTHTHAYMYIYI